MSKRVKSNNCCAVAQCVNWGFKEPGTIYHTFPKSEEFRHVWVSCCKRANTFNVNNARVCSKHFLPGDYKRDLKNELLGLPRRKILHSDAVPSQRIPNWHGDVIASTSSSESMTQAPSDREICKEARTESSTIEDKPLIDMKSEACRIQETPQVMECVWLPVKHEPQIDDQSISNIKEGPSQDVEECDVHCNLLKLEPKAEITVEDHCISAEERSNEVRTWSSDADVSNLETAASPSYSSPVSTIRPVYNDTMQNVNNGIEANCDIPDEMFGSTMKESHKCTQCGKCFTRSSSVADHLNIHSGEKNYKCTDCGKCFTHSSNLRAHLKIHSGKKDHKCTTCGKCFTYGSNLKEHLRIHVTEKDHKCTKCGKGFNRISGLRDHLKFHFDEKDHKCTECGKSFSRSSSLVDHLKIHSGQKDHKCEICGHCFTQSRNLKKHLKVHTGEKDHKCSICGQCFTQRSNLTQHLKVHAGKREYKCAECAHCFIDLSNLRKHLKVHFGEKNNKCAVCGKCFLQVGTLRRHSKIHRRQENHISV